MIQESPQSLRCNFCVGGDCVYLVFLQWKARLQSQQCLPVGFLPWLRIWLTPQPKPSCFSDQSHDAALAWERHLSASGLLSIKSHCLATHHVAMVCLGYMLTTFLKIIVNICWIWYPDLNVRKIEVLQSTVPVTWFDYLKNKTKYAHWGSLGWAGIFCGIL